MGGVFEGDGWPSDCAGPQLCTHGGWKGLMWVRGGFSGANTHKSGNCIQQLPHIPSSYALWTPNSPPTWPAPNGIANEPEKFEEWAGTSSRRKLPKAGNKNLPLCAKRNIIKFKPRQAANKNG